MPRIARSCALLLALVGWLAPEAQAQTARLNGFVTDASDGAPLELVNVALLGQSGALRGAVTTRDGLYVLPDVPPGAYVLRATFIGYRAHVDTLTLAPGQARTVNIALVPDAEQMDEVLVETERAGGAARVTAGQQTLRPRDIELVPAPDLSGDLATLLATLPGVVAVGDRGGQFFIRGGEPSQNLVQLDGALLYQPFHVLGFYSAFPADIISRTDVYAGGFGSRFGERISSVIDVGTRNGNLQRYEGAVTVSPFAAAGRLEGPLVRDRLSVLASVRQSLVEEAAARLVDDPLPFRFGDAFVKLHGIVHPNVRASATGLYTHDRGTLGEDVGGAAPEEVRWTNALASTRLLVLPRRSPIYADLRVSLSQLRSELGPTGAPTRTSRVANFLVAGDATFFGTRTDVDVGFTARVIALESEFGGLFQNIELAEERLTHVGAYVEPELQLGRALQVRPGLRLQFFDVRFQPYLEPRLRIVWAPGPHQVSAALGRYHQATLGLTDRRDAASVFTAWTIVPGERTDLDDVREGRAQEAWHGLLGYRYAAPGGVELSVEGFYKRLSNLFIGEWTAYPRFTTDLQPASGRAYGFDLRVEGRWPRLYGYVNYGYSNTFYEAEQATLRLWYGTETLGFRPPHDRRHQVNALVATTVRGIDLSARWTFGSGLPFSRAVGFDGFVVVDDVTSIAERPGSRRVIYERPYTGLLPTYHRLDLSVEHSFDVGAAEVTVQGTLINAYDRRNLFYLDVFTLRRVDQLPLIPSLGLKLAY